jgi:hypothetical protein
MYAVVVRSATLQSQASMIVDRSRLIERLVRRLRSDEGSPGWGYYAGKAGRVEPTCWALLALRATWNARVEEWSDFARSHFAFLAARQGSDGLLSDTEPGLVNLAANGLASVLVSAAGAPVDRQVFDRLHAGLVNVKGVRLSESDSGQNNALQGWPWVRDTFSWVEPTAWCLLAMKARGTEPQAPDTRARVREAEDLLINRVCAAGGWNYGNASTLGQDLRPYIPTTAVALIALQDRRDHAATEQSLRWLQGARLSEPSAFALSLTAICLRVFGLPVDDVEDRLAEAVEQSEHSAHLQAMAMAIFALSADVHNVEALRVRA